MKYISLFNESWENDAYQKLSKDEHDEEIRKWMSDHKEEPMSNVNSYFPKLRRLIRKIFGRRNIKIHLSDSGSTHIWFKHRSTGFSIRFYEDRWILVVKDTPNINLPGRGPTGTHFDYYICDDWWGLEELLKSWK